jgi:hypothetical protein
MHRIQKEKKNKGSFEFKVIEWKKLCFRLIRLGMRRRNIILLLISGWGIGEKRRWAGKAQATNSFCHTKINSLLHSSPWEKKNEFSSASSKQKLIQN